MFHGYGAEEKFVWFESMFWIFSVEFGGLFLILGSMLETYHWQSRYLILSIVWLV